MGNAKSAVITFKADAALADALQAIPNRSEFIRHAILAAMDNACPLCGGTGVLTTRQKEHWEAFSRDHALQRCEECHEFHLTCSAEQEA